MKRNDQDIFDYIKNNRERYLGWLYEACRIPSVSTEGRCMEEMASHLVSFLREHLGIRAEMLPSGGYPFVCGEMDGVSPRTILFYNHYDVQPVEPIEEWESDPFEPTVRDGRIYGRGTSDNKGSLFARLCALHAYKQVRGALPLRVKIFFEGEEEIGSPSLAEAPVRYLERIRCDGMLWEGESKDVGGPLHISLGVKGLAYFQLTVRTAPHDLHSAEAGIVPNPAWRLVWALSTIKDENERILIDGFYDDIERDTEEDRFFLENMTYPEEDAKKHYGIRDFLGGIKGYDLKHRLLYEPTANICGIVSGYTAAGSKTIVPASASAKLDFRLVPNMRASRVQERLRRHLDKHGFHDIDVELLSGKPPYRTDPSDPLVRSVISCAERVYGMYPAVYRNMSGTTSMYDFCTAIGAPAVLVGVANEDSRAHAPNENIFVEDYISGIKMIAAVLGDYGGERDAAS